MAAVVCAVKSFFAGIVNIYRGWCRRHNFKPIVLLAVIVIVLTSVVALAAYDGAEPEVPEVTPEKGKTTRLVLGNIGELATQVGYYTNVQVIRDDQKLWGWDVPFTETECVFSFDGIIKVGYDFENICMVIDDEQKTIEINMPEPHIISNEIDTESMKIYDEDKNMFTPLTLDDFGSKLEQMREEARYDAVENGLFDNARTNAETLIKGFVAGVYDLSEYEVVFIYVSEEPETTGNDTDNTEELSEE